MIKVKVQTEDFDLSREYAELRQAAGAELGAISCFSGLVREIQGNEQLKCLYLEHYPAMTEVSLKEIAQQAKSRWQLHAVTIIHRVGELRPQDQIVLVVCAAAHRAAAYEANEFIMDYLKTRAPFWKKAIYDDRGEWVDANQLDQHRADRWAEK